MKEKLKVFLAITLILFVQNSETFPDWLIEDIGIKSRLRILPNNIIELTNGLISRQFTLKPGFATIDLFSHERKSSLLRAIQPEAVIWIDEIKYNVGGLKTFNMSRAYLNRTQLWQNAETDEKSLKFIKYETGNIKARYPYKPQRYLLKEFLS